LFARDYGGLMSSARSTTARLKFIKTSTFLKYIYNSQFINIIPLSILLSLLSVNHSDDSFTSYSAVDSKHFDRFKIFMSRLCYLSLISPFPISLSLRFSSSVVLTSIFPPRSDAVLFFSRVRSATRFVVSQGDERIRKITGCRSRFCIPR